MIDMLKIRKKSQAHPFEIYINGGLITSTWYAASLKPIVRKLIK